MDEALTPPGTTLSGTLQSALDAYRRGLVDEALALAGRHMAVTASTDFSGHSVMGEVLFRAGRIDELLEFLDLADDFVAQPHGRLLQARALRRRGGAEQAETLFNDLIAAAGTDPAQQPVRRVAAFELSLMLDQQGRHAEAWRAAQDEHARTARPYPVQQLVEALRVTAQASAVELLGLPRATKPAGRTAFILGMPRSGTTLLEQMLDCHPRVQGVGELPLPGQMADAIAHAGGGWPIGALKVPIKTLNDLQKRYLWETRGRRQIKADCYTLDKTVFPMLQPLFIAGVLPGAKVIRITRDARDNAVSLFLNNFDPSWGWTTSLDSIRQVLDAERRYLPVILERLRLDALHIRFEDLVDQPETTLRAVLAHLGVDWDAACLQPQDNQRLVFTLSREQVRRPINRQGIGRWQQHAAAFGPAWGELV